MKDIKTIRDDRFAALLNEVKDEVLGIFGEKLEQVVLYGSYARGDQDPESDIDIMILVDITEAGLKQYNDKISGIMSQLSLKYDVLVSLTEETAARYKEWLNVLPYYQNIYNEGIEVYGKKSA